MGKNDKEVEMSDDIRRTKRRTVWARHIDTTTTTGIGNHGGYMLESDTDIQFKTKSEELIKNVLPADADATDACSTGTDTILSHDAPPSENPPSTPNVQSPSLSTLRTRKVSKRKKSFSLIKFRFKTFDLGDLNKIDPTKEESSQDVTENQQKMKRHSTPNPREAKKFSIFKRSSSEHNVTSKQRTRKSAQTECEIPYRELATYEEFVRNAARPRSSTLQINEDNELKGWELDIFLEHYRNDRNNALPARMNRLVFRNGVELDLPSMTSEGERLSLATKLFLRRNAIHVYDAKELKRILRQYISMKQIMFFE